MEPLMDLDTPNALGLMAVLEVYVTKKVRPSRAKLFLKRFDLIFDDAEELDISEIGNVVRLMDMGQITFDRYGRRFDRYYSEWVTIIARLTSYEAIRDMTMRIKGICDTLLDIDSSSAANYVGRINPGLKIEQVVEISAFATIIGNNSRESLDIEEVIPVLQELIDTPGAMIFPQSDGSEFEFGRQRAPRREIPPETILSLTGPGMDEPNHDMHEPWQISSLYQEALRNNDLPQALSVIQLNHDRRPTIGAYSALFKIACALSHARNPKVAIDSAATAISLATRAGDYYEAIRISIWLFTIAMDMFLVKIPDQVGGTGGLWDYLLDHRDMPDAQQILSEQTMAQLDLYTNLFHGESVERISELYRLCKTIYYSTAHIELNVRYSFYQLHCDMRSVLGQGDLLQLELETAKRTSLATEVNPTLRTMIAVTYALRRGFTLDCTRDALELINDDLESAFGTMLLPDQLRFWHGVSHILETHLAIKEGKLTLAHEYLMLVLSAFSPRDRHLTISARSLHLDWLIASHRYSEAVDQARAYCNQLTDPSFCEVSQCTEYNVRALEAEIHMAGTAAEQLTKALATADTMAKMCVRNGQIASLHRARYLECVALGRLGRIDDALAAATALIKELGIQGMPATVCRVNLLLETLLTAQAVFKEVINTRTLKAYTRMTELLLSVYHLNDFDHMHAQHIRLGSILEYMTVNIESCAEIDSFRAAWALAKEEMANGSDVQADYRDIDMYIKIMADLQG